MELFSLLAKLTLDANEYHDELNEAQREANDFESPPEQKLELDASDFDTELTTSEAQAESFSQNVGLVGMTKIVNLFAITMGAIFLVLCGFIPKLAADQFLILYTQIYRSSGCQTDPHHKNNGE